MTPEEKLKHEAEQAVKHLKNLSRHIETIMPEELTENIPQEYKKDIEESLKEMNDAKKKLSKQIRDANRA